MSRRRRIRRKGKYGREDYLWIATTPDKYEFPIFICDSAEELARKLGITPSGVSHACNKVKKGTKYRVYKVLVKEEIEYEVENEQNNSNVEKCKQ